MRLLGRSRKRNEYDVNQLNLYHAANVTKIIIEIGPLAHYNGKATLLQTSKYEKADNSVKPTIRSGIGSSSYGYAGELTSSYSKPRFPFTGLF